MIFLFLYEVDEARRAMNATPTLRYEKSFDFLVVVNFQNRVQLRALGNGLVGILIVGIILGQR